MSRILLLALGFVVACAPASGSLRLFVSGEEAAEVGFPTSGPEPITFTDGWSISFDHVVVAIDAVSVGGGPLARPPMIVDLHRGRAQLFDEPGLGAGRLAVGYTLAPASADAIEIGTVDPAVRARMIAAGTSMDIEGTASHATHGSYTFAFALPGTVTAEDCEQADGTLGVVVPENGTAEGEITIHLDHLFFDSATAEEPGLRFEAWAAVAGDDRHVTMDELRAQDLTDLVGIDGMPLDDEGTLVVYEPPATGLPSLNLREHVLAQAITVPHWMGEGHCAYR